MHAVADEMVRQTRRLGVVEDDDVVATDPPVDCVHVGGEDSMVVRGLPGSEIPVVAGCAVNAVVQSLGDGEEFGIGVNDQPARVGAGIVGVTAEEFEHLRHPSAVRGGADVPDPDPVERLQRGPCRLP